MSVWAESGRSLQVLRPWAISQNRTFSQKWSNASDQWRQSGRSGHSIFCIQGFIRSSTVFCRAAAFTLSFPETGRSALCGRIENLDLPGPSEQAPKTFHPVSIPGTILQRANTLDADQVIKPESEGTRSNPCRFERLAVLLLNGKKKPLAQHF